MNLCILVVACGACTQDSGQPYIVSELQILAPVPGNSTSVAYFAIENRTDSATYIRSISSPQFERVEMHETVVTDEVARMRPTGPIEIEGPGRVVFAAGGRHVMLMRPLTEMQPGAAVTLELNIDAGLVIVDTTLQSRLPENQR